MRLSINSEITKSRMGLNMLDNIRKIPGGLMLVPMGIAAVINTFIYILGFILLIIFLVVNNIPMLFIDRIILKQKGHASTAICCVAGLSIAVPKLMAEVDAAYRPYVESAASQIAFVVVISTVITPILVKRLSK